MSRYSIFIWVVYILLKSTCAQGQATYLDNVDCGSYVDYIATDPSYHRYNPYFIKLNRCHGISRSSNPTIKRCLPVPEGVKTIPIYVFDAFAPYQIINVENHTLCEEKCVLLPSNCTRYEEYSAQNCKCSCNYTSAPTDRPCVDPFYWDQTACDCKCKHRSLTCNTKKQEFNKDICGCTCKQKFQLRCAKQQMVLDPNTCLCLDPAIVTGKVQADCEGDIKGGILAVIMILEALGFILGYFFVYSYCYKRRYLSGKEAKKHLSYNSSYQNGNVPFNRPNEFNTMTVYEEDSVSASNATADKGFVIDERKSYETQDLFPARPLYYSDKERSHLTKKDDDWYTYNDVTEIDSPSKNDSSSLVSENDLAPPDYSDYISSGMSEDGYKSVTIV